MVLGQGSGSYKLPDNLLILPNRGERPVTSDVMSQASCCEKGKLDAATLGMMMVINVYHVRIYVPSSNYDRM